MLPELALNMICVCFPVDQVESIEIMKGAASTLYGSGAATAVINITLKNQVKNRFKPMHT